MIKDESGRDVAPNQEEPKGSSHYKLICCKCLIVLEEGPPGAEVSHGYCETCLAEEMK